MFDWFHPISLAGGLLGGMLVRFVYAHTIGPKITAAIARVRKAL